MLAERGVQVYIYEPRSTNKPDGSIGGKILPCTGCAGLVQDSARRLLKSVGLEIPEEVIQAKLKQTVVHFPNTDETINIRTDARTVYRGWSPLKQPEGTKIESFDAWLLRMAIDAGAIHIQTRVKKVIGESNKVKIVTDSGDFAADLVIGAYGNATTIERDGTLKSVHMDRPITKNAGVREYIISEEALTNLSSSIHIFGNPTPNVWFALVTPKAKANYVTIALMARDDITPQDYNDFLELPKIKQLLVGISNISSCACINPITIVSPQHFMAADETGQLTLVNIGDAGPTRPRKNGIFAALDEPINL